MSTTQITNSTKKRKFGLDLLRALAIIFVLYVHSFTFLTAYTDVQTLALFKFDGVTLFFVLSGFLIGQIIIKIYENASTFNFAVLKNFWLRRWLRTLPIYYLILFVTYFAFGHNLGANLFSYLTFTQNLVTPHPAFFEVAWSLSVEEWFYLTVPLLLLILSQVSSNKRGNILAIIFIVFVFSYFMRGYEASQYAVHELKGINSIIRKTVIFRLDSIIFGVLAAYIKFYHGNLWNKYSSHALFFGIGVLIFLKIFPIMKLGRFFYYVIFSNILAFGTMCLLPYLDTMKMSDGWFKKAITHISLISYSLYLSHTFIKAALIKINLFSPIINTLLMWVISIIVSTAMYFLFEKPILNWRDRKVPDENKPA